MTFMDKIMYTTWLYEELNNSGYWLFYNLDRKES